LKPSIISHNDTVFFSVFSSSSLLVYSSAISFHLGMMRSNLPEHQFLFVLMVNCCMTAGIHGVDCVLILFLYQNLFQKLYAL
jgi:hypothetical protein